MASSTGSLITSSLHVIRSLPAAALVTVCRASVLGQGLLAQQAAVSPRIIWKFKDRHTEQWRASKGRLPEGRRCCWFSERGSRSPAPLGPPGFHGDIYLGCCPSPVARTACFGFSLGFTTGSCLLRQGFCSSKIRGKRKMMNTVALGQALGQTLGHTWPGGRDCSAATDSGTHRLSPHTPLESFPRGGPGPLALSPRSSSRPASAHCMVSLPHRITRIIQTDCFPFFGSKCVH